MMATIDKQLADAGYYTTMQAAEYLGTSYRYMRKLITQGDLRPAERLMNRLLFTRGQLDAFKADHPLIGRFYKRSA